MPRLPVVLGWIEECDEAVGTELDQNDRVSHLSRLRYEGDAEPRFAQALQEKLAVGSGVRIEPVRDSVRRAIHE